MAFAEKIDKHLLDFFPVNMNIGSPSYQRFEDIKSIPGAEDLQKISQLLPVIIFCRRSEGVSITRDGILAKSLNSASSRLSLGLPLLQLPLPRNSSILLKIRDLPHLIPSFKRSLGMTALLESGGSLISWAILLAISFHALILSACMFFFLADFKFFYHLH